MNDAVTPHQGEIEEAKKHPNGYVYRITGKFAPDDRVPPEAIIGAWKVDQFGKITGAFIANPGYDGTHWPSQA